MYSHILLPTDGSDVAARALRHGISLAKLCQSRMTILTVRPPIDDFTAEGVAIRICEEDREAFGRKMENKLNEALQEARTSGILAEGRHVENSSVWRAVIATAQNVGVDLIVMGSHGRTGLSALVLGSQTSKVLNHCKVPLLVCR